MSLRIVRAAQRTSRAMAIGDKTRTALAGRIKRLRTYEGGRKHLRSHTKIEMGADEMMRRPVKPRSLKK